MVTRVLSYRRVCVGTLGAYTRGMALKQWMVIKGQDEHGGAPYTKIEGELTKKEAKAKALDLNAKAGRLCSPKGYLYFIAKQ